MRRTQGRESMCHGLDRVRQAARERKGERFTALLHHIDVELLRVGLRLAAEGGIGGRGRGDVGGIRRGSRGTSS